VENTDSNKKHWEFDSEQDHYEFLIGQDYGPNAISQREAIQKDKALLADGLKKLLEVQPADQGLEIGSGCGFITSQMAKYVEHLYGADISSTYLELAKKQCLERKNTSFHLVKSGKLGFLNESSIDFIYSNNVFIHLDIYEIISYLQEAHRILKNDGRLWFDFVNLDCVDFSKNADFLNSMKTREVDPSNKHCLQFNSSTAIIKAAEQMGFSIKDTIHSGRCNTQLLLIKSGPPSVTNSFKKLKFILQKSGRRARRSFWNALHFKKPFSLNG